MILRTLVLASSALLLPVVAASAADAATHRTRHTSVHHAMNMHHGRTMAGRMSRGGGDAQNSTVDQLNAQSLAAARGGAAPVAQ